MIGLEIIILDWIIPFTRIPDSFKNKRQFFVTLWHVHEEIVSSQIDVVDNLAKVLLEVGVCKVLEVIERVLWNITFPVKVT